MLEQLGSGQFGRVYKGLWMCEGEALHVAVKVLQERAEEGERVKFLKEAALMGQFAHSNIVRLYGVVTVTAPVSVPRGNTRTTHAHTQWLFKAVFVFVQPLIVLELALTDLHRYLRGIRLRSVT